MARGRQAAMLAKNLKEEGKQEALNQVEKKKRAITEGVKARDKGIELTPENARNMSLKELEQLLPKA